MVIQAASSSMPKVSTSCAPVPIFIQLFQIWIDPYGQSSFPGSCWVKYSWAIPFCVALNRPCPFYFRLCWGLLGLLSCNSGYLLTSLQLLLLQFRTLQLLCCTSIPILLRILLSVQPTFISFFIPGFAIPFQVRTSTMIALSYCSFLTISWRIWHPSSLITSLPGQLVKFSFLTPSWAWAWDRASCEGLGGLGGLN